MTTRSIHARHAALLALAGAAAMSAPARADDAGAGAEIQRFWPSANTRGGFGVGSADGFSPGDWAIGLHLNYARNPLVLVESGERRRATIANNLTTELHGAVGLVEAVELGLVLPVVAWQNGDDPRLAVASPAAGDLRLEPRFRLLSQFTDGVSLALAPVVIVPLPASPSALAVESMIAAAPQVEFTYQWRRAMVGGQVGVLVRASREAARFLHTGSELFARASGAWRFGPVLAIAEVSAGLPLTTTPGLLTSPAEALAGLRWFAGEQVALDVAAGAGLLSGPGTPDARVVAGLTYGRGLMPRPQGACRRDGPFGPERVRTDGSDRDGDGIADVCDHCAGDYGKTISGCPDRDADGIPDSQDGCPDQAGPAPTGCPDRDGDGLIDKDDACPADFGPPPAGCPDSDGDAINDRDDRCPHEPGRAPTGCPDGDGDGVVDLLDRCPKQPGLPGTGCPDSDGDGLEDPQDQCPAEAGIPPTGCPDSDGDGIVDAIDACPKQKGPAPTGCPDTDGDAILDPLDWCPHDKGPPPVGCADSDADGIFDRDDQCPKVAGPPPTGCPPDPARRTLVVLRKERIEILEQVFFATDRDVIEERSFPLLRQVADLLKKHPELPLVRIEGHTDDVGGREHNLELSRRRAIAVRRFLLAEGVAPGRTIARGYGFDVPMVPNDTEQHRAVNRRVQFTILSPEEAATTPPDPAVLPAPPPEKPAKKTGRKSR